MSQPVTPMTPCACSEKSVRDCSMQLLPAKIPRRGLCWLIRHRWRYIKGVTFGCYIGCGGFECRRCGRGGQWVMRDLGGGSAVGDYIRSIGWRRADGTKSLQEIEPILPDGRVIG